MAVLNQVETEEEVKSEQPYGDRFVLNNMVTFMICLSYNAWWMRMIVISILLEFLIQSYTLSFFVSFSGYFYLRLVCDVMFLIEIILCVLYKLSHTRFKTHYKPRETHLIVLDTITMLSFDYLIDFGEHARQNPFFIIMNVLFFLRIYRLVLYATREDKKTQRLSFARLLIRIVLGSYLILHILTCIWRMALGFETAPWTRGLVGTSVILNDVSDQFIVTMYLVTGLMYTIGYGDLNPITTAEYYLACICQVVGLFWLSLAIAVLVSHYDDDMNNKFKFDQRFGLICKDLAEHESIPRRIVMKVLDFYKCLWIYKSGILESPLFHILPVNIQRLVFVDQYWEALEKSSLLNLLDLATKSALAEKMRSQMHVTGDIIVKQGEMRTFMMYVVKGCVRILSGEDTESPVTVLGEGSLLCESSLIVPNPSPVQIEAGSICEIQILDRVNLFLTAMHYQNTSGTVHKVFNEIFKKTVALQTAHLYNESLSEATNIPPGNVYEETEESTEQDFPPYTWLHPDEMSHLEHKEVEKKPTFGIYVTRKDCTNICDELCASGKFPFTFMPQTSPLLIWDFIVFCTILAAAFLYPLRAAFGTYYSFYEQLFLVDIVYVLDLIVSTSTAIEYNGRWLVNLYDILRYRLTHAGTFVVIFVDMFCIFPLHIIYKDHDDYIRTLLSLNHLLKSWKILMFCRQLEERLSVNIGVIRIPECLICIFIISFWMGIFYYIQACFREECREASFYTHVLSRAMEPGGSAERVTNKVQFIMAVGIGLLNNSGYPDLYPGNMVEIFILLVLSVVSCLILGCFVGTYSAALVIRHAPKTSFMDLTYITKIFMDKNNLEKNIQERVLLYLKLQWEAGKGYYILHKRLLYFDTPPVLLFDLMAAARREEILSVPLFEDTEESLVNYIANHAELYNLPPHEILVYPGTPCHAFYILKDGFCEKKSGLTGNSEGIYGPKSNFCVMEMLFGMATTSEIKTKTNVKLLRIPLRQLQNAWSHFPLTRNEILGLVKEFQDEGALSKVSKKRKPNFSGRYEKPPAKSFCRFSRNNGDYKKHFRGYCNAILRYVLMPVTIIPNGKFIKIWEALRIATALFGSVFFPPYSYLWLALPYLRIIRYLLDIITLADMYIACHVCFYTERGVLVTHPKATFYHYLSHNFVIDLLCVFPFDILSVSVEYEKMEGYYWQNTLAYFAFFPKILSLYHCFSIREYKDPGRTKRYEDYLGDIVFMYCAFIIANFSATILMIITIKPVYTYNGEKYVILYPEHSWVSSKHFESDFTQSIFFVHIMAVYWTVCVDFNVLFGDILPMRGVEMVYLTATFITGYGIVAVIMVKCSSTLTGLGLYFTVYKENLKQLDDFLRNNRVHYDLQHEIIAHFLHHWSVTRSLEPQLIFSVLNISLRQDAVTYLYEPTFKECIMFREMDFSFCRAVSMLVQERYYKNGSKILQLNDVINEIYFIHKGEASLLGASDSELALLSRGSVFGNILNNARSRFTCTVTAISDVVILKIENRQLYDLLKNYPFIENDISKMTAHNKLYIPARSFLSSKGQGIHRADTNRDASKAMKAFDEGVIRRMTREVFHVIEQYVRICLVLFCVLSLIIITYHAAFQDHSPPVFAIEIALSCVFLGKFIWSLYMPPEPNNALLKDEKYFRERYMKSWSGFWLDLTCFLPIYLLSFFAPKETRSEIWSYLNLFNLTRMYYFFQFYYSDEMELSVNRILLEFFKISIMIIFSLHVSSCVIYYGACFKNKCSKDKWAYTPTGDEVRPNNVPDSIYLCSMYAAINIYTSTAIGTFVADTIDEICIWTVLIIVGRFHVFILKGQISAVVYNYFYTVKTYNYKKKILMIFLKCCNLSNTLKDHIESYVQNLWTCGKCGVQMPVFFYKMPSCLKSNMMDEIYGYHIYDNPIFRDCHPDFTRQLLMYLKPMQYFPQNVIVQKGIIDGIIYCVDEGEVEVLSYDNSELVIEATLKPGDMFGVVQSLYKMTPHGYTFRAVRNTVIITLQYDDWSYLLPFFPETYRGIYERMYSMFFHLMSPIDEVVSGNV